MTAYWADAAVALHLGDCRNILPTIADQTVDAVVTDPPYELGFMGQQWDASGIAYDTAMWAECLRVLKPGGHLVAFGAPRTYHRLAVAIEDAGFDIRDSLHWIYGTGFPKGADIGKAIDKRRDDRPAILAVTAWLAAARDAAGWTNRQIDALWGFDGMAGHWTTQGIAATVPTVEQWQRLQAELGFGTEMDDAVRQLNARKGTLGEAYADRELRGEHPAGHLPGSARVYGRFKGDGQITAPASEQARQWDGWNTALKPAHEPIVLARKGTGFHSTVATVLQHGTGALNVAACRTGDRWPTNLLLTHDPDCGDDACTTACPVRSLDEQAGPRTSGANPTRRSSSKFGHLYGQFDGQAECTPVRGANTGAASRFFPVFRYQAKADRAERVEVNGVAHSTVKPLALMRWLVRLVTPPGGVVLDPFAGSGTTLLAARDEGFDAIGVEEHEPHAAIAVHRLEQAHQPGLFAEPA